jgi:nucleoid DNA-binding protein
MALFPLSRPDERRLCLGGLDAPASPTLDGSFHADFIIERTLPQVNRADIFGLTFFRRKITLYGLQGAFMIKNDIALAIEKKSDFNGAKSLEIVEAILEALKDALTRKDKVEIRGFGSFKVVAKKTGYGRDIRRQKQIHITQGKRIKFRCGQELKSVAPKSG